MTSQFAFLTRWIDICHGCHQSLHKRFNQPTAWQGRLDRHGVDASHWARLVSPARFDLASLLEARGAQEPTWESVTTLPDPLRRGPRQRFGEMGIPPGRAWSTRERRNWRCGSSTITG